MAPSFAHTKMRRAEEGGPEQCARPFSRRFFDQTPRRKRFRQAIRDKKKRAVIGSKPERPRKLPKSRALYSKRYLVECFFHKLKRFRAIATRFEKTARNFLALTQVACAWLWLAPN
jgi:transposase